MKGAIGFLAMSLSLVVAVVCMLGACDGSRATTNYVGDMFIYDDTTISDGTWVINGSVYVLSGTLRVEDAIIVLNSQQYESNLVYVEVECTLQVYRSRIEGATSGTGIYTTGDVLLDNTTMYNLGSDTLRGGIYQTGGEVLVENCNFDTGAYGIFSKDDLTVRHCTFNNISSYAIYWSSQTSGSRVLISDCTVEGFGNGNGFRIRNMDGYNYKVAVTIRRCTLENLKCAIHCEAFYSLGSLVVEDNVVRGYLQGARLVGIGMATTLQHNMWVSNTTEGHGIYLYRYGSTQPDVNNETTIGGGTGLVYYGNGKPLIVRDMNITASRYGLSSYYDDVLIHDSYVRAIRYEFCTNSGFIYLYNCDHTRKVSVGGDGAVIEQSNIRFTSVTWQEGTPIEEGVIGFSNDTGVRLANLDIEHLGPVDIPVWKHTNDMNITVEEVHAELEKDGITFHSKPFDPRCVERMDLVIIDNATPEVVVVRPADGDKFDSDMLWFKGNWSEQGAGLGTVRVRYPGGDWVEANISDEGKWQAFLTDVPDGLLVFQVNISDKAGNSLEVAVVNITIDTVWPQVEVLKPLPYVCSSAVHLIGRTEPLVEVFVDHRRVEVMQDGMFSALLYLTDGENEVLIRAVDQVGHVSETRYYVMLDTEPPALLVETPMDGCWLSSASVTVTGSTEIDTTVYVNERSCGMDNDWFSIQVPLEAGVNLITVEARDLAGNVAMVVCTVHVDRDPPVLKVTSHGNGTTTSEVGTVLSGIVSEENLDRVLVNNISAQVLGGEWLREVSLEPGQNSFKVVALDLAGNRAEVSICLASDPEAPVISATMDIDGVVHGPTSVPVLTNNGTVLLDVATSEESLLTVNGGDPLPFGPGSTSLTLVLEPDIRRYTVRVTDLVGNEADPLTFVVVFDDFPPMLFVATSQKVVRTRDNQYLVKGETEPGCTLTVNGIPTPNMSEGRFAMWVSLEEGSNILQVVSTDTAGNYASVTLEVVREPEVAKGEHGARSAELGFAVGIIVGTTTTLLAVHMRNRRRHRGK